MKITLNGLENPNNIITFTNCPTILTVSDAWTGTRARSTIEVKNLSSVRTPDEYSIKVGDYYIRGTGDLSKSVGNRFYITSSNTLANRVLVARKIVDAINSLGGITMSYRVWQDSDNNGQLLPRVIVEAIDVGIAGVGISIKDLMPSGIITIDGTGGSITSIFNGNITNKIHVDIYKNNSPVTRINAPNWTRGSFIAQLEKTVWGGTVSFDLSNIFNAESEIGTLSGYEIIVSSEVDGDITTLGDLKYIYATPGYLVNQGGSFIPKFTGCYLAQNVSRGNSVGGVNKSILYVYYNSIVFSLYADNSMGTVRCTIDYLNNSQASLGTETQNIFCGNNLNTFTLSLNQLLLQQSSYIDVNIPNVGKLRYNVIKPIHATDETQRIYWTNSYGGTSFFDFTGTRTEERKTDIETYQRSLYDYYTSDRQELKRIYSKEVKITVTLTTHNIQKDGTWQLFDLQNSYNAWTTVNGKEYAIHITDIQVDETDVAGIYTAQIEYEYSMGDTF